MAELTLEIQSRSTITNVLLMICLDVPFKKMILIVALVLLAIILMSIMFVRRILMEQSQTVRSIMVLQTLVIYVPIYSWDQELLNHIFVLLLFLLLIVKTMMEPSTLLPVLNVQLDSMLPIMFVLLERMELLVTVWLIIQKMTRVKSVRAIINWLLILMVTYVLLWVQIVRLWKQLLELIVQLVQIDLCLLQVQLHVHLDPLPIVRPILQLLLAPMLLLVALVLLDML